MCPHPATPLLTGALLATTMLGASPARPSPGESPVEGQALAGLHALRIGPPTAEGAPKEVSVLADLPAVKIVAITLRGGLRLAEHQAALPVMIEVVHGAATLEVAGSATPLHPGAFVVLGANTVHAVVPVDGAPITLLVHHHKAGGQ